jgi:hypothetical protein
MEEGGNLTAGEVGAKKWPSVAWLPTLWRICSAILPKSVTLPCSSTGAGATSFSPSWANCPDR